MNVLRHNLLLCLLTSGALLAGDAVVEPAASAIDDNDVLEAVEAELRAGDGVDADLIDVQVNAGVVTLSGRSFTLLGKRQAKRLVGSLKGVRAIVDRVRVMPSDRPDAKIQSDVVAALKSDAVADTNEIGGRVAEGRVTLDGEVDSFAERRLVEAAVANVRGVLEIDNQIEVNVDGNRPDCEIKAEILRRFELSPFLAEGLIDVQLSDGVVTLRGAVGSVNEREIARALSAVAAVRKVQASELKVDPSRRHERRRDKFTVLRNDVQLKQAVQDALLYDPRIRGTTIDVRVRYGAVSLSGNVASLAAKRAAQRDAKNTLGVRRVINQLKVKPAKWPGDAAITKRVQAALARDAHLADSPVRVSSHFGKVYLTGKVRSPFERRRAEAVAANVAGALDVINRLDADRRILLKLDDEIREDVERRLSWSPLLDAKRIRTSVDDGVVTLRGHVDTWQEREAATRHAYQAGARRVLNRLEVRSWRVVPAGIKATLEANQTDYTLDPRHASDDFLRQIESREKLDTERLPPPPKVDLVLTLNNVSQKPIDVRVGHDKGGIKLSLTGDGAAHVPLRRTFVADFRAGRVVTIQPGDHFEMPIRSLEYGFRNSSDRWYWTAPGAYRLHASFTWPTDSSGANPQTVIAPAVKLNVTAN